MDVGTFDVFERDEVADLHKRIAEAPFCHTSNRNYPAEVAALNVKGQFHEDLDGAWDAQS